MHINNDECLEEYVASPLHRATATILLILLPLYKNYNMSSKPVALILGSGPRVGAAVAKILANTGYSVAVASRKATEGKSAEGYLSIKADLSNPSSVPAVFDAVKTEFQSSPSIVVYNAAALTPPAGDDLFSIPAASLATDLNTNTVSVYAAAQEAVKGWETLAKDTKKVFIYTGNKQNIEIGPWLLTATLGIGKSASAYLIGTADTRYSKHGYR
jgi:NAD(P)-dependent dehydrogenase (short-subunit alcohol dehydrogenase family)